ncbi:hypothetical protein BZL54_02340 [Burkholderia ubonensis subsp. mesacidophila]|uniref:Uncharacterized protein n=2 Tax=Burkholderia ubonensis TaxID=101571 RepID=A0A2A4FLR5_9BURK|nr:hypothetical protein BZL54_02340 [Burkholderia ubonensis subsp. mesacidophila]
MASLPFASEWQVSVAARRGVVPRNAFESFLDVNGDYVLDRIHALVVIALQRELPVMFQQPAN